MAAMGLRQAIAHSDHFGRHNGVVAPQASQLSHAMTAELLPGARLHRVVPTPK